jgi:hypothetical protein
MAINCTGVSASWDGGAFVEVSKIDIQRGGSLPQARGSNWTLDAGTIEVTSFSTAQLTAGQYGKKATLVFAGGGLDATVKAICQSLRATGTVNDVTRYIGIFKISME